MTEIKKSQRLVYMCKWRWRSSHIYLLFGFSSSAACPELSPEIFHSLVPRLSLTPLKCLVYCRYFILLVNRPSSIWLEVTHSLQRLDYLSTLRRVPCIKSHRICGNLSNGNIIGLCNDSISPTVTSSQKSVNLASLSGASNTSMCYQ